MAINDKVEDLPVTQVGSAFHQLAELKLRLKYLAENPELKEKHPDEYVDACLQYENAMMALFTEGCDRGAWHWYSSRSNDGLDR